MSSLLVFNRVYRLEIQSVMLIFWTGFLPLLPSLWLSLPLPPSPLPYANKYTGYTYTQCARGGSLGSKEGTRPQTDKTPAAKVPLQVNFIR